MRNKSTRRTHQQRVRLGKFQELVKKQAINWIMELDVVLEIDYSDGGDGVQIMTVKGIPKKRSGKIELDDNF